MGPNSSSRSDDHPGASSDVSKPSRGVAGTSKPARVSKTKTPDGANSDHRKQQNRIASRNYREKRKHKLDLLKQILDDPSAEDGRLSAATSITIPSQLPASTAHADNVDDTLFDSLTGSLAAMTDLPPLVADLPTINTTLPQLSAPTSTATAPSYAAAADELPMEDSFAAWAALNLPSAMAANSLGKDATAAAPASSTVGLYTNMPTLQPWSIPLADCQPSPFSSHLSPLFPTAYAQSSPATSADTSTASARPHTLSNLGVTEAFGIDDSFEPVNEMDRMDGNDGTHSNGVAADWYSDDANSASCYTNNFQAIQMQGTGIPSEQTVQSDLLLPIVFASPKNGRQQQSRPMTATLPSRPSPRLNLLPLASPTNVTNGAGQESQKQSSPKYKPVARSMVQYIRKLSPHQKRLILQALLDDDGGVGGHTNGRFSDSGHDRIEAIDISGGGSDNNNEDSAKRQDSLISRREDRRRQVVARWNSYRWAGEAAEIEAAHHNGSSASSTYSTASSSSDAAEVASYANIAVSGLGGPSPQARSWTGPQLPYSSSLSILTLQCRRMGFRAALLSNCLACGLADPDAMFDESCNEECAEAQSPFALRNDEARAVVLQGVGQIATAVATVRRNLACSGKMPPHDLQPVDAQILVAHHPYLDVIPFRDFRARALALLAVMEADEKVAAAVSDSLRRSGMDTELTCVLDEDELCYDMNVADGLVCWGSQVGNAGASLSAQAKRGSDSARDMRSCQPWDMRSWEPQVWFLKKYWFLVGGWDDEMWRNCRWWHSMRGDDLDYSVFALPEY
ncbi:hypothetical protein SEPCBS119000_002448 [Sporothrix epigloea]|uniref:BZIP domain-containing protein n=1 Tax=Sporothrix epigloea TaxID=1892477 RepID=A0ABP0DG81_9PEZI